MMTEKIESAQLKGYYLNGYDENGENVEVTKSFGEMAPEAGNEAILKTCRAFEKLLDLPMISARKTVITEISD